MTYQRDYSPRLRIAVVGLGSHSYRNILPALTHLPIELSAVCDLNQDVAERTGAQYAAAAYIDFETMLDEQSLDAVVLAVSPHLHPTMAVNAFARGLDVFMEKPAATSVADLDKMIAARGDRVAVVGVKKAFMPAITKAKQLLDVDGFGPLTNALGVYEIDVPRSGDVHDPDAAAAWLANSSHPLAALLEVCGPAKSVTVHRSENGGGVLVLRLGGGALVSLVLAHGTPQSQPHEAYTFFGARGRVEVQNNALVKLQRGIPFDYANTTSFAPPGLDHGAVVWEAQHSFSTLENKSLFIQGIVPELMHFCECSMSRSLATVGTLEFVRHLTEIYETAMVSEGNEIRLETGY